MTKEMELTIGQLRDTDRMYTFGSNVKVCLELLGMSPESLSLRTEIDEGTLQAILNGMLVLTNDYIDAICSEIGLSRASLLTEYQTPSEQHQLLRHKLQEAKRLPASPRATSRNDESDKPPEQQAAPIHQENPATNVTEPAAFEDEETEADAHETEEADAEEVVEDGAEVVEEVETVELEDDATNMADSTLLEGEELESDADDNDNSDAENLVIDGAQASELIEADAEELVEFFEDEADEVVEAGELAEDSDPEPEDEVTDVTEPAEFQDEETEVDADDAEEADREEVVEDGAEAVEEVETVEQPSLPDSNQSTSDEEEGADHEEGETMSSTEKATLHWDADGKIATIGDQTFNIKDRKIRMQIGTRAMDRKDSDEKLEDLLARAGVKRTKSWFYQLKTQGNCAITPEEIGRFAIALKTTTRFLLTGEEGEATADTGGSDAEEPAANDAPEADAEEVVEDGAEAEDDGKEGNEGQIENLYWDDQDDLIATIDGQEYDLRDPEVQTAIATRIGSFRGEDESWDNFFKEMPKGRAWFRELELGDAKVFGEDIDLFAVALGTTTPLLVAGKDVDATEEAPAEQPVELVAEVPADTGGSDAEEPAANNAPDADAEEVVEDGAEAEGQQLAVVGFTKPPLEEDSALAISNPGDSHVQGYFKQLVLDDSTMPGGGYTTGQLIVATHAPTPDWCDIYLRMTKKGQYALEQLEGFVRIFDDAGDHELQANALHHILAHAINLAKNGSP